MGPGWLEGRSPKSAVPIRIMVAPSSTATSKSTPAAGKAPSTDLVTLTSANSMLVTSQVTLSPAAGVKALSPSQSTLPLT